MTRIAVLSVLPMVVGALVSPSLGHMPAPMAVRPADDPYLITPGVGIGKVKIGMPIAAVMSIMGTPKNICRGRGEGKIVVYTWFETDSMCFSLPQSDGGLLVYTDVA